MCSLKASGKCKMAGNGFCKTYCLGVKEEKDANSKKA